MQKISQLLQDKQIDLSVVEGLRLVIAFTKIAAPSDRRMLIELAERIATSQPAIGLHPS
jgi:hypothetical protein